jgi:hypothetical protein
VARTGERFSPFFETTGVLSMAQGITPSFYLCKFLHRFGESSEIGRVIYRRQSLIPRESYGE